MTRSEIPRPRRRSAPVEIVNARRRRARDDDSRREKVSPSQRAHLPRRPPPSPRSPGQRKESRRHGARESPRHRRERLGRRRRGPGGHQIDPRARRLRHHRRHRAHGAKHHGRARHPRRAVGVHRTTDRDRGARFTARRGEDGHAGDGGDDDAGGGGDRASWIAKRGRGYGDVGEGRREFVGGGRVAGDADEVGAVGDGDHAERPGGGGAVGRRRERISTRYDGDARGRAGRIGV